MAGTPPKNHGLFHLWLCESHWPKVLSLNLGRGGGGGESTFLKHHLPTNLGKAHCPTISNTQTTRRFDQKRLPRAPPACPDLPSPAPQLERRRSPGRGRPSLSRRWRRPRPEGRSRSSRLGRGRRAGRGRPGGRTLRRRSARSPGRRPSPREETCPRSSVLLCGRGCV